MSENNNNQEEAKPRRRVKKSKGHGGHHGGAWKVAYADFVTAMMALFLVLWLVSQADTKLKEAIANYFRSPGVFSSMKGGILSQASKVSKEPGNLTSKDDEQALFSVAQTLQKKFSTRPEFSRFGDQVKVDVTDEGLRIQLIDKADKVSFPSGSADLTDDAKEILSEIAKEICALPNKINIGGHTDNRPFAAANGYTNWELSADRANAARRILESICVKPEQINRIIGYADTDPLVANDPSSPSNRRISITLLRLDTGKKDGSKKSDKPQNLEEIGKRVEKKIDDLDSDEDSEKDSDEDSQDEPKEKPKEKRLSEEKLKNNGTVTVGEPDEIPAKPKK